MLFSRAFGALLAAFFLLSGCQTTSTETVITRPGNGSVAVKGLNVFFINAAMKDRYSSGKDVGKLAAALKSQQVTLRDAVVGQLPGHLSQKGLKADAIAVEFDQQDRPISTGPFGQREFHRLLIMPIAARESCRGGACISVFTISIKLMAPGQNNSVWDVTLKEPDGGLLQQNGDARFNEFVVDIAESISRVVLPAQ